MAGIICLFPDLAANVLMQYLLPSCPLPPLRPFFIPIPLSSLPCFLCFIFRFLPSFIQRASLSPFPPQLPFCPPFSLLSTLYFSCLPPLPFFLTFVLPLLLSCSLPFCRGPSSVPSFPSLFLPLLSTSYGFHLSLCPFPLSHASFTSPLNASL